MIRALTLLLIGQLLIGLNSSGEAAGAPAEKSDAEDPTQSFKTTRSASYVALPDAILLSMRNRILEQRGEAPEEPVESGGH
ncbi:MAG: hypothetical protein CML03_10465 [Pseudooceanicola sp.]|nr:hypothetical protein [Pseudooceanicola sp.]|tara:strand:- start:1602 stop:1844 length:243 start_codon:yes stop_codon:yes gene_type:complete